VTAPQVVEWCGFGRSTKLFKPREISIWTAESKKEQLSAQTATYRIQESERKKQL